MKHTQDECWLTKNIYSNELKKYSINSNDRISQTIRKEIPLLFPELQEVAIEGDIQFIVDSKVGLGAEGFRIRNVEQRYTLEAEASAGLLYGLYQLYEFLVCEEVVETVYESLPDQHLRMINHWDNMDGSIERGYAGDSIFYKDNTFRRDLKKIRAYARLLASTGINGITLNNVNVHKVESRLILDEFLPDVKLLNDIFSAYGIKTYLCVNFASPKTLGGLATADPLNEEVNRFWADIVQNIYQVIPDFGGFVIKADSEGEPGPFAYGRSHDEGANMFGRALKPYGGICIWRCFVYNHQQDWRDRSIDRAKAAYDHFMPLDGKFEENVILQIKLGPLDFQVQEPVSPLFGGLKKTNQIIEFQLTQEYTGQQKAVYYQVPVWKEALDFDTKHSAALSPVKELLKKNSPNEKLSGICAVGVVGMDDNWTGHKLMQSNLYAYGRLAWNNQRSSLDIAESWVKLTFDLSLANNEKLVNMLTTSRETYRLYTAPKGVGFMCRPNHHYGPDIDGYEYDRWGTYHFADRNGVGVDRTLKGTGFVTQYATERCAEYNDPASCPDELLLWFHHVAYDYILRNGKTLIQDIYDTHFEGVERVEHYLTDWIEMSNEVAVCDYTNVLERLEEQRRLAIDWRDQVNTYFYRKSGVKDQHGRKIYD